MVRAVLFALLIHRFLSAAGLRLGIISISMTAASPASVQRSFPKAIAAILKTGATATVSSSTERQIDRCFLEDGDAISFGFDDSYEIIFRSRADDISIQNMLDRMGSLTTSDVAPGGLRKLNLLLEATSLLHSQLPLDSVLGTMLDHAIVITDADRGLLLEADSSGLLSVRLARGTGGARLSPKSLAPSQTALRLALEQQSSVITEDLNLSDLELQVAESIVAQQLRAIVAIPLYSMPRASSTATVIFKPGLFLGVLYLDSRRPAAFSKLDRQILDALAVEAASILDNARLVEQERQRQRLEQELSIARDIQQALLPSGFRDFPHFAVTGINSPCLAVGGDYFDVFPITDDRTAFLIADVSGKGLGAALLTTMLQGALAGMTIGADPARVFQLINRFLCEHSEVGRYATMFFGILGLNGRLDYINAGHPPPLLLRRGEVTVPFTEGFFPVGLIPETDYVTSRAELVGSRTGAILRRFSLSVAPRFLWECLTSRTVSWFPAPATSNPSCRFPAMGLPVCFRSRVMWPTRLAGLSAVTMVDEAGNRCRVPASHRATSYSTSSNRDLVAPGHASDGPEPSFLPSL